MAANYAINLSATQKHWETEVANLRKTIVRQEAQLAIHNSSKGKEKLEAPEREITALKKKVAESEERIAKLSSDLDAVKSQAEAYAKVRAEHAEGEAMRLERELRELKDEVTKREAVIQKLVAVKVQTYSNSEDYQRDLRELKRDFNMKGASFSIDCMRALGYLTDDQYAAYNTLVMSGEAKLPLDHAAEEFNSEDEEDNEDDDEEQEQADAHNSEIQNEGGADAQNEETHDDDARTNSEVSDATTQTQTFLLRIMLVVTRMESV